MSNHSQHENNSYNHAEVEAKWQQFWAHNQTFKAANPGEEGADKPKFYVLDMFPYPSGAGLHVGHPLGYIASDIVSRFKRHQGFNVLHPMGYDSFGLPAEQYAIQTGQHPAKTTTENINRYRQQLDRIGFSFDWSREVRTSEPQYYKWTQWIFLKLFNSWFNPDSHKAEPIEKLIAHFEQTGSQGLESENVKTFTAKEWASFSESDKQEILMNFRLAYLSEAYVNWCPALGTVLANDEVKDGFSERGGHPVERKKMKQWSMRITAYADRLLQGLENLEWNENVKEIQRNWIGKSEGCSIQFQLAPRADLTPGPSPGGEGGALDNAEFNENGPEKYFDFENEIDRSKIRHTTSEKYWAMRISKAKEMRHNPTKAEDAMWQLLRNAKTGFKIRRQHIIDKYIVDFVCLSKLLVIEVDGDIHDHQVEEDKARTEKLNELGFTVIRYRNEEVLNEPERVTKDIKEVLHSLPTSNPNDETKQSPLGETSSLDIPLSLRRGAWGEVKDSIEVFTTRPDTLFGVSYLTLAPEHDLVLQITVPEQKEEVEKYIQYAKTRSERDRQTEVKKITGVFTGAYAIHPFTEDEIPVWIGDYVLAGYGTGAVMAVPAHDERDFAFAKFFGLPVPQVVECPEGFDLSEQAWTEKSGKVINSDFLNGLEVKAAIKKMIEKVEEIGIGKGKTNFRLRDAVFGRQRYWGEPIPVYFKDGIPYAVEQKHLPLNLPEVDKFLPTESGKPPLARATHWNYHPDKGIVANGEGYPLEATTMPGWAGSSWYFFRYMDAQNQNDFASDNALNYWKDVDFYVGGAEHATGHLLYARFWTQFLHDIGKSPVREPFRKLLNQGMILGESAMISKLHYVVPDPINTSSLTYKENLPEIYLSKKYSEAVYSGVNNISNNEHLKLRGELNIKISEILKEKLEWSYESHLLNNISKINVDVNLVENEQLDIEQLKDKRKEFRKLIFISEDNSTFIVSREIEKMSKSKWNVVNPDEICEQYGADTLRMYEMFLGPIEDAKPWNTKGIEGVYKFLRKTWRLFHNTSGSFEMSSELPDEKELKTLHKTIKKITWDIENLSFNTSISAFMICVNELQELKCNKRSVLEPLLILLSPFAPHFAEELWEKCGHSGGVSKVIWPVFEEKYLTESNINYPISINGKMRTQINLPTNMGKDEVEKAVLADETVQKWLEGKPLKKFIFVPGKIVNVVV
jgi:leucyl-tRNA synthetase